MKKKLLFILLSVFMIGCGKKENVVLESETETAGVAIETELESKSEVTVLSKLKNLQIDVSSLLFTSKKDLSGIVNQNRINVLSARMNASQNLNEEETKILELIKEELALVQEMFSLREKVKALLKNGAVVDGAEQLLKEIDALIAVVEPEFAKTLIKRFLP